MSKIKSAILETYKLITGTKNNISIRMTQYFLFLILAWNAWNFLGNAVLNQQKIITYYFGILTTSLLLFLFLGYLVRKEAYFVEAFNIALVVMTPVTWYVCGGSTSNTVNSLFILVIIYYTLCSYGKRRIIGCAVTILEVATCNSMVARNSAFAKPPYAPGPFLQGNNTLLGMSTTIVIILLMLKQVREYTDEKSRSEAYEEDLKRSYELQKMFLANMSHEIRSPLGIVLGFNDLIAQSESITDIREYSKNIAASGETLKVVINDILDYSKIESGKLDIIERDYSLKKMVEEIKRNIKLKASEKGLSFTVSIDEDVPDMLFGDDVRIRQCLINVLSNAVKYTENGDVLLKVSKAESKEDGICTLKFVCHDTGKGIPKEAIPYLFSAFERVDESHNRGIEGTGLGLAITKSLMDEMNGTILVESTVGVGSDFTLVLSQKLSEKQPVCSEKEAEYSLKDCRIAVVDDTKPNLILCKKILELYGANVSTFDNGVSFLDACSKSKYDVLLIDHMMPVMDGIEVHKRLVEAKGLNSDTPCLAFTANAMAGVEKEFLDMGFDGFVSKPVNKASLVSKICLLTGTMIK